MTREISFRLNGRPVKTNVEDNALLLNHLRDDLTLTGTKYVCGIGECGACTVMVDGEPNLSCLTLAAEVDGKDVTTIEGLDQGNMTPVQKALLHEGGIQCGFCTPGFVMVTEAQLKTRPKPSEQEIRQTQKGNLCRCTGYVNIVKGIQTVTPTASE